MSRREFIAITSAALAGATADVGAMQTPARRLYAYVGSRTRGPGFGVGGGGGITVFAVDSRDGSLRQVSATGAEHDDLNSDGLCISADNRYLYAVNETPNLGGKVGAGGGVLAFAINPADGSLRHLNTQPSMGANPCYIVIDKSGSRVLVANHGDVSRIVTVVKRNGISVIENPTDDGTVAMLPVRPDGSIEPASDVAVFTRRPPGEPGPGAAAHSVNFDRTGRFAIACDVGADHIYVYPFSPSSRTLVGKAFATPPGKAPRHSVFHPRAPYFFITNEREASLSSFHFDSTPGAVKAVQTVPTVPAGYAGPRVSPSNIRMHPNGRFLYGANRGDDSIAIFRIDEATGRMSPVDIVKSQGTNPREMNFDPSGKFFFVANVQSNEIVTFAVDEETGKLAPTEAKAAVARPSCIHLAAL